MYSSKKSFMFSDTLELIIFPLRYFPKELKTFVLYR